jgi:transposase
LAHPRQGVTALFRVKGFVAFLDWLNTFGDTPQPWVCMEATGAYSIPLAEFLVARGCRVSVINPANIHAFAKRELSRAKTDKADAKRIARYGLTMQPARWTPPPPAIRERQALLRRVEHRLEMQPMERNRLATADAAIVDSLHTILATLAGERSETRRRINALINDTPYLRERRDRLESIPGIGPAASAYRLVARSDH